MNITTGALAGLGLALLMALGWGGCERNAANALREQVGALQSAAEANADTCEAASKASEDTIIALQAELGQCRRGVEADQDRAAEALAQLRARERGLAGELEASRRRIRALERRSPEASDWLNTPVPAEIAAEARQ